MGDRSQSAARQAIVIATLMMAWQVAAKATRDSLFLSAFLPSALPGIVGASAVSSILFALLSAKLLRRYGPFRLIPAGYLLGATLHALEWLFYPAFPKAVSAAVYVHVIALGAVLLSGFWAMVNERFDPREARRRFGQITAFGTLGSLAGGVAAERVVALTSGRDLLLLLLGLQVVCAAALLQFAPPVRAEKTQRKPASIPQVISGAPYLVGLAFLVLLVAMSAGTLDYLFKYQSVARFGRGATLSRFFALFYAVTSGITFVIQMGVSRFWLKRFSPGRTILVLPVTLTGASLASLIAPGALALIISRGLEQVLRGALFRSGYELFYTPMPPAEKRATKSVIDIGADRLGDGLAAATIQLLIALPAGISTRVILGVTALLGGLAAWVAVRLDTAYVDVLQKGLAAHTVLMTPEETADGGMHSIISQRLPMAVANLQQPGKTDDPVVQQLADLRSADLARVRAVLRAETPPDPVLIAPMIHLLGWDDAAKDAHAALLKCGERIAGQLVDALRDQAVNFQVRKRIPRILAASHGALAWDGLFEALHDERFEIRVRCARALEKMQERRPEHRPEAGAVFALVGEELANARKLAGEHTGGGGSDSGTSPRMHRVLDERSSQTMTHICSLLGLILPTESVRLAFRALRTQDPKLRGVALEYLDSVLPAQLGQQLCAHLEGPAPERKKAPPDDALANLIESSPSIVARLWEVEAAAPRTIPPAGPPYNPPAAHGEAGGRAPRDT